MSIILEALLIFGLRVLGIAISTLSTLMTVRGRKFYAVAAGFFSSLVYVIAIGKVVTNLGNVWNILAYAGGFAGGTLVGMLLEQRLALGFAEVRFISTEDGQDLADTIREAGYGVTELEGHGRDRTVEVIAVLIPRREVQSVLDIARTVDDAAIVTVSEPRSVQRGYWRPETCQR
ncbi:MAG: DUF5698 domain-containing protein [Anaerolineae bacterium]|jgi:uncharacterized protein YebE (UPF0316 family)